MMPIVKGDDSTRVQILVYSIILVSVSMTLGFFGIGWIYLVTALILGFLFIQKAYQLYREKSDKKARGLFGFSLIYLFGLFAAMMIEGVI